jgi:endonuclease/exonuclease/phosphatase (EEP) superfamily protein YafD
VHWALGFAALGLLMLVLRRFAVAGVAAALSLVDLAVVSPVWLARRAAVQEEWPALRVLLANVLTGNRDPGRLLALIEKHDPDVIALIETDQRWLQALERVRGEYPHVVLEPRPDNFGMALLSRVPLESPRVVAAAGDLPRIEARIRGVDFLLVHTMPPVSAYAADLRDRQLAELPAGGPRTLVCGDLNATPWSHAFRALIGRTGLQDSRRGFGVSASWPARLGALGIPIDHCLFRGLVVESRRVLPDIGSDHRPVELVVRLPPIG